MACGCCYRPRTGGILGSVAWDVSRLGLSGPAPRGAWSKCYITRGATPCKLPHRDTLDLPIEWQFPKTRARNPSTAPPHKSVPLGPLRNIVPLRPLQGRSPSTVIPLRHNIVPLRPSPLYNIVPLRPFQGGSPWRYLPFWGSLLFFWGGLLPLWGGILPSWGYPVLLGWGCFLPVGWVFCFSCG